VFFFFFFFFFLGLFFVGKFSFFLNIMCRRENIFLKNKKRLPFFFLVLKFAKISHFD